MRLPITLQRLNPRAYVVGSTAKYYLVATSAAVALVGGLVFLASKGALPGVGLSIPQTGLVQWIGRTVSGVGAILSLFFLSMRSYKGAPAFVVRCLEDSKTVEHQGKHYVVWEPLKERKTTHAGLIEEPDPYYGEWVHIEGRIIYKFWDSAAAKRQVPLDLIRALPKGCYYITSSSSYHSCIEIVFEEAEKKLSTITAMPPVEYTCPILMIPGARGKENPKSVEKTGKGIPVISWAYKISRQRDVNDFIYAETLVQPGLTNQQVAEQAKVRIDAYREGKRSEQLEG